MLPRFRRFRRSGRCGSTTRACLCAAAVSGRAGGGAPARAPGSTDRQQRRRPETGARADRDRHRQRSRRSPSSTCPAAAASAASAARIAARREAPSIASRRTACGISSGNRATTRPTISSSTPEGALIVGTGNKGKIYRLEGDPLQPTLLARRRRAAGDGVLQDRQGPSVFRHRRIPGKLFRLSTPIAPTRGTYESEPRDAQTVVHVGRRSAGAARCRQADRSRGLHAIGQRRYAWTTPGAPGRRPTPWPTARPIISPKARFLQWRGGR